MPVVRDKPTFTTESAAAELASSIETSRPDTAMFPGVTAASSTVTENALALGTDDLSSVLLKRNATFEPLTEPETSRGRHP